MSDTRPLRNGAILSSVVKIILVSLLSIMGWFANSGWSYTQQRIDGTDLKINTVESRVTRIESSMAESITDRKWMRESLGRIEAMVKESRDRELRH